MPELSFDELFSAMAEEWNKAEKAIKHAENVDGEVVNPAIFELRYAGRRLVEAQATKSTDLTLSLSLLRDAKFDCHRARHDAIDAATSKMVGDLHEAVNFLSASIVLKHFPLFTELYGGLSKVRSRIAISREDRKNRDKIYESIESVDLDKLIDQYDKFKACEPLMLQVAQKEQSDAADLARQARESIRVARISMWAAIVVLIVTVVGVIFAYMALH